MSAPMEPTLHLEGDGVEVRVRRYLGNRPVVPIQVVAVHGARLEVGRPSFVNAGHWTQLNPKRAAVLLGERGAGLNDFLSWLTSNTGTTGVLAVNVHRDLDLASLVFRIGETMGNALDLSKGFPYAMRTLDGHVEPGTLLVFVDYDRGDDALLHPLLGGLHGVLSSGGLKNVRVLLLGERERDLPLDEGSYFRDVSEVMRLAPLSIPEQRLLATHRIGANVAEEDLWTLNEFTGGQPLLVRTVLDRVTTNGGDFRAAGEWCEEGTIGIERWKSRLREILLLPGQRGLVAQLAEGATKRSFEPNLYELISSGWVNLHRYSRSTLDRPPAWGMSRCHATFAQDVLLRREP